MSLSDIDHDEFKPLSLSSLEQFGGEHSNNKDKTRPDFNRFEMLFEKTHFEKEESYEFKAIYDKKKEKEEIVFKPLVENQDESFKKEKKDQGQQVLPEKEEQEEPEETPEEKGYRQGFEKGQEQGIKKGQDQGFEKGFKKGEARGFEQGEAKGFEQGEKKGLEQGLEIGKEKGEKETREKAGKILNSLEESLKTADKTLDFLVEKYEERIISLIQKIAYKAVKAEIEINQEIVKDMVLDALKTLVQPEEVVLSVSLDDYEYIEMVKEEFFDKIDSLTSVSVRSDPSVKRGGCKIETITALVSADPESRLESIFEAIKNAGA
ncbi:MAG: hypothetical protein GXP56_14960 [Deltaproteobacteria bacterium]|nr:hypothetical protein [Deltaproteobacteria bacterium]